MLFFYRISIWLYALIVSILSAVNLRAKIFYKQRRGIFEDILFDFEKRSGKLYWIHAASIGEYEQAKPLVEYLKTHQIGIKILVTFFSPAGYEHNKDNSQIDFIHYLPMDTKSNARKFLEIVKPDLAIFVKYEFWYFFLIELKKRNIPTFLISGIFRRNQMYFHPLGGFYLPAFRSFTHFFLQDEFSGVLLRKLGMRNWTVTGDTRFDRVVKIASENKELEFLKDFKGDERMIILGSIWPSDMDELDWYVSAYSSKYKFVIAPHTLDLRLINRLLQFKGAVLLSEGNPKSTDRILIVDQMGVLAYAYKYADLAVIGGAFRGNLHNTLEPAVFGIPVFFGESDSNQKFIEATELKECGGGFSFKNEKELADLMRDIMENKEHYQRACEASGEFVKGRSGAAEKVYNKIVELI